MGDLKLHSVNWQDGMLMSKKHLAEQETYIENLARWYALRTSDDFGLVRKSFSGQGALALNLALTGNRLRVQVDRCHALTPSGQIICIEGEYPVRGEMDVSSTVVPVYIGVDTSSKRPVGNPEPDEDVPRIPYLSPNYSVHLGKPPDLPAGDYIQVARLQVSGSEVNQAPGYYPPCIHIYADQQLSEKASDLKNRLENLLSLTSRAYAGVTASGTLKGESTSLQVAFKETMALFLQHLASNVDGFIVGPNAGHPLSLVAFFKKLFRTVSTLMNLHSNLKDYLNEKFFTRELRSDVGSFLSSIDAFLLAEYNHQDLGGHIKNIEGILNPLRDLLAFLAQTKTEELGEQAMATETLTYNGRTYRNLRYHGSRLEQVGELSYLMITIAEPCPVSDIVTLMTKSLFNTTAWRNMHVRLGINDARGLGETDPIDVDTTSFGNKVALHPRDMLEAASVRQITIIFRGAPDPDKFNELGQLDLILYRM